MFFKSQPLLEYFRESSGKHSTVNFLNERLFTCTLTHTLFPLEDGQTEPFCAPVQMMKIQMELVAFLRNPRASERLRREIFSEWLFCSGTTMILSIIPIRSAPANATHQKPEDIRMQGPGCHFCDRVSWFSWLRNETKRVINAFRTTFPYNDRVISIADYFLERYQVYHHWSFLDILIVIFSYTWLYI